MVCACCPGCVHVGGVGLFGTAWVCCCLVCACCPGCVHVGGVGLFGTAWVCCCLVCACCPGCVHVGGVGLFGTCATSLTAVSAATAAKPSGDTTRPPPPHPPPCHLTVAIAAGRVFPGSAAAGTYPVFCAQLARYKVGGFACLRAALGAHLLPPRPPRHLTNTSPQPAVRVLHSARC